MARPIYCRNPDCGIPIAADRIYCSRKCLHTFTPRMYEICLKHAPGHPPSVEVLNQILLLMVQKYKTYRRASIIIGLTRPAFRTLRKRINFEEYRTRHG